MTNVLGDLLSLQKDINILSEDKIDSHVNRLIYLFTKELHITPTEFRTLELPLIFALLEELNKDNKEQERSLKKRR